MMRFLLVLLIACGGSKATPPAKPPAAAGSGSDPSPSVSVGLALTVTPSDAIVELDDIRMGAAANIDPVFALAPGLHTLVITRESYKPYRIEFSVTDKVEKFDIKLERKK